MAGLVAPSHASHQILSPLAFLLLSVTSTRLRRPRCPACRCPTSPLLQPQHDDVGTLLTPHLIYKCLTTIPPRHGHSVLAVSMLSSTAACHHWAAVSYSIPSPSPRVLWKNSHAHALRRTHPSLDVRSPTHTLPPHPRSRRWHRRTYDDSISPTHAPLQWTLRDVMTTPTPMSHRDFWPPQCWPGSTPY